MSNVQLVIEGRDEASPVLDNVNSGIKGLAGTAKSVAGTALKGLALGFGGVLTAAAGLGAGAFKVSMDVDKAAMNMASSMGISREEAEKFEGTMKGIFANNFGENFEDIGSAISEISRQLGDMPQDALQGVTEDAFALRDTFEVDIAESSNAAKALIEEFGLSGEQAMDFIAHGMQQGLNSSDDFLDSIREYGGLFSTAGFGADEFFSIMETGAATGVLGTDKIADAIKEMQIKLNEGDEKAAAALANMGLNLDEMQGFVASGDESWASYFDNILEGLAGIDDPVAKSQAEMAIFGTMAEDLGAGFSDSLSIAATSMGDMEQATEKLNIRYGDFGSLLEGTKRQAMVALSPLGDMLLEIANDAMPMVTSAFSYFENDLVPALENVGSKIGPFLEGAREFVSTNIAPALTSAAEGLGEMARTAGDFVASEVVPFIKDAATTVGDLVSAAQDFVAVEIMPIVDNLAPRFANLASSAGKFIKSGLVGFFKKLVEFLTPAVEALGNFAQSKAVPFFKQVGKAVGSFVEALQEGESPVQALIDAFQKHFPKAFAAAQTAINTVQRVWQMLVSLFGPSIQKIIEAAGTFRTQFENIKPAIQDLWTAVQTFWNIIQPILVAVGTAFLAVGLAVQKLVYEVIAAAMNNFGTIVSGAIAIVTGLFEGLAGIISGVINVIAGLFTGDWARLWEGAKQIVSGVVTTVGGIFSGLVQIFGGIIQTIVESLGGWLGGIADFIGQWFGDQPWAEKVIAVLDGFAEGLGKFGEHVGSTIDQWVDVFTTAIDTWLPNLISIGEDMVQGVIDGIGNATEWLRSKVEEIVGYIPGWMKNILGIASPAEATKPVGEGAVQGVATGMLDTIPVVVGAINEVVAALGGGLKEGLGDWLLDVADGIKAFLATISELLDFEAGEGFGKTVKAWRDDTLELTDALAEIADHYTGEAIESIRATALAAMDIGVMVPAIIEGLQALREFEPIADLEDIVDKFGQHVRAIVREFHDIENMLSNSAERDIKDTADAAGAIAVMIGPMIAGLKEMVRLDTDTKGIKEGVANFAARVKDVLLEFHSVAGTLGTEGIESIQSFSKAAATVLALTRSGIDSLLALVDFNVDMSKVIGGAGNLAVGVANLAWQMYLSARNIQGEVLDNAVAFAEGAGVIVDMVIGGIASLKELEGFRSDIRRIQGGAVELAAGVATLALRLAEASRSVTEDALESANIFAAGVGGIVDFIAPAIDALINISEYTRQANLREASIAFRDDLMLAGGILVNVLGNLEEDVKEMLAQAAKIAPDISAVAGAINPAIDALKGIGDFVGIENLSEKMTLFGDYLVAAIDELGTRLSTLPPETAAMLAYAAEASPMITKALGFIVPAVEALMAIAELDLGKGFSIKLVNFGHALNAAGQHLKVTFEGLRESIGDALPMMSEVSGKMRPVLENVRAIADDLRSLSEIGQTEDEDGVRVIKLDGIKKQLDWVVAQSALLKDAFGGESLLPSDVLARADAFAATVTGILAMLTDVIESLVDFASLETPGGVGDILNSILDTMESMTPRAFEAGKLFGDAWVQGVTEALQTVFGSIGSGLGLDASGNVGGGGAAALAGGGGGINLGGVTINMENNIQGELDLDNLPLVIVETLRQMIAEGG